jgi:protein-ribulosamine 3-kinase
VALSLADAVARVLNVRAVDDVVSVGGGSISDAYRAKTEHGCVFVKVGVLSAAPMFETEAAGLDELQATGAVRVPNVLAVATLEDRAVLCLEWLDLAGKTAPAETRLGEQLAALHRHRASRHGWDRDNYIGSNLQRNSRTDDWVTFFRLQRLEPQLHLARAHRADPKTLERGQRLCESLGAFFVGHRPIPSLLHGDLWGGNWNSLTGGQPVIFDPAIYYGDRETDIAMTRLFGGFGPNFYAAYEAVWPLEQGAATRATLYNLYHVLNHFNLFGGGYLPQARSMIDRLLAEVGK